VERNPLRAGLVSRAADWRWSSLGQVCQNLPRPPLDAGPVARPANWLTLVDRAETEAELLALRRSVLRGAPFGTEAWQTETARRLGLESSLRPLGRPVKLREIKRDAKRTKSNKVESTPDPFLGPCRFESW
jgi:putative transposase